MVLGRLLDAVRFLWWWWWYGWGISGHDAVAWTEISKQHPHAFMRVYVYTGYPQSASGDDRQTLPSSSFAVSTDVAGKRRAFHSVCPVYGALSLLTVLPRKEPQRGKKSFSLGKGGCYMFSVKFGVGSRKPFFVFVACEVSSATHTRTQVNFSSLPRRERRSFSWV